MCTTRRGGTADIAVVMAGIDITGGVVFTVVGVIMVTGVSAGCSGDLRRHIRTFGMVTK